MGMVLTYDVSHYAGRLLVGLVVGVAELVHGIEYAPVNRLEPVPHVGKGPTHYDAHSVV